MKEVRCYDAELYTLSLSMLIGKSPKVKIVCGECKHYFSKRFDMYEINNSTPKAICPYCGTVNIIPICT